MRCTQKITKSNYLFRIRAVNLTNEITINFENDRVSNPLSFAKNKNLVCFTLYSVWCQRLKVQHRRLGGAGELKIVTYGQQHLAAIHK